MRGEHVSIAAIILAAGRSRRMGTQKLLLPWHGKTVIQQVVGEVLAAGLNPVVVVTGGDSASDTAAIQQTLRGLPVTITDNPDRDAEMLSSIRCGLKALPRESTAALITPGDLLGISSELVSRLTVAIEKSNRGMVMPIYQGTRGHPTIIAAKYFDEVLTQYDGVGTARPHVHSSPRYSRSRGQQCSGDSRDEYPGRLSAASGTRSCGALAIAKHQTDFASSAALCGCYSTNWVAWSLSANCSKFAGHGDFGFLQKSAGSFVDTKSAICTSRQRALVA